MKIWEQVTILPFAIVMYYFGLPSYAIGIFIIVMVVRSFWDNYKNKLDVLENKIDELRKVEENRNVLLSNQIKKEAVEKEKAENEKYRKAQRKFGHNAMPHLYKEDEFGDIDIKLQSFLWEKERNQNHWIDSRKFLMIKKLYEKFKDRTLDNMEDLEKKNTLLNISEAEKLITNIELYSNDLKNKINEDVDATEVEKNYLVYMYQTFLLNIPEAVDKINNSKDIKNILNDCLSSISEIMNLIPKKSK